MRTFAQLLRDYIDRIGVSDAELARALGVRRQTIFRWKEGLSERPRHREDVLRLSTRLRLTSDERDLLLLAAGFAPEAPVLPAGALPIAPGRAEGEPVPPGTSQAPIDEAGRGYGPAEAVTTETSRGAGSGPAEAITAETASGPAPAAAAEGGPGTAPGGSAAGQAAEGGAVARDTPAAPAPASAEPGSGAAAAAGGAPQAAIDGHEAAAIGAFPPGSQPAIGRRRRVPAWTWGSLALLVVAAALLATLRWRWAASYPAAHQGEMLILVARFANYSGGQQGYNVAGRLQTALQREITGGQLQDVRAVEWPDEVRDEAAAAAAVRRARAAVMIWGEYDSGRVLCHFTGPARDAAAGQLEELIATPADLSATINSTLPEEVRNVALVTIAQVAIGQGNMERARAALTQALARPPAAPDAVASLYFRLGYVAQKEDPPDWPAAIDYYSRALELLPGSASAHNNRGISYLQRGRDGDLDLALADLSQALAAVPDDAAAYNNRAAVYLRRRAPGDMALALADLTRTIALAPAAPEAYFNRGLVYLRQGDAPRWQADFQKVLAMDARHAGALGGLCWGYALDGQPALALPYCERAVAADTTPASHDARGLAYAQLGRLAAAAADFRAFLAWVEAAPANPYAPYAGERRAWITALDAGQNPFDAATLAQLRQE